MISCNSESTLNDKDPERLLQSESCNVYLRNDKVGLMSRTNGNGMFRFFCCYFYYGMFHCMEHNLFSISVRFYFMDFKSDKLVALPSNDSFSNTSNMWDWCDQSQEPVTQPF